MCGKKDRDGKWSDTVTWRDTVGWWGVGWRDTVGWRGEGVRCRHEAVACRGVRCGTRRLVGGVRG